MLSIPGDNKLEHGTIDKTHWHHLKDAQLTNVGLIVINAAAVHPSHFKRHVNNIEGHLRAREIRNLASMFDSIYALDA